MPIRIRELPTSFYLGRQIDPESGDPTDTPVYYDSRDMTTHAVVVGMTGSGKTGLCISLLEEAILDNIPAIIIDPKGDITNLLLTFPDLRPEDFRPWINVDDARRAGKEPDQFSEEIAQRWQEGLRESGIVPGRLGAFKRAAQFSIYTPGSDAGLPISILDSLSAPKEGWTGYEESHRERISGTVTALLALIGKNADPVQDREHILIANIFEEAWKRGESLSLEQIIFRVQTPPFGKLGVFDLDTAFPKKDRNKLAMALNQIVAAPSFQTWLQGEGLDVRNLLYTPEGRPHVSIFYIAHLNDAERMFMITLILENMLSWMRSLSGTTSLRAVLYFDEVFGYFPPFPHNPPSKGPLLRLLKQARAFGIGLILATQNPVDLDYKGLANAGTWFIGKLQTDNDRKRILGGLEDALTAQSQVDVKSIDRAIRKLNQRQFVLNNVHNNEGPTLFTTRWAMNYLRGPLTRQQVRILMESQRAALNLNMPELPNQYTAAQGAIAPQTPPEPNYSNTAPLTPPPAPSEATGLFSGSRPNNPFSTFAPTPQPTTFPGENPNSGSGTFGARLLDAARRPQGVGTEPPATSPTHPPAAHPEMTPMPAPVVHPPTPVAQTPPPAAQRAIPRHIPEGYHTEVALTTVNLPHYFIPPRTTVTEAVRGWEGKFGVVAASVDNPVILYRPVLLAQAVARYVDRKAGVQDDQYYCFQVPDLSPTGFVNWAQHVTLPVDPTGIATAPPELGSPLYFGDMPSGFSESKRLTALKNEVVDHVYRTGNLTLLYNATLDLYGTVNETKRDYSIRLQSAARQARDVEIEKVTAKFDTALDALDEKLKKELRDHNVDLRVLEELKREETYTTGEAVFNLLRGRPSYTLSRMSRARRQKSGLQERAFANEQQITQIEAEMEAKQDELRVALNAVNEKWMAVASTIEETKITPYKKDISLQLFGIGWAPSWCILINGQIVIIPSV
jgi:transcriptional regulator NrdR family protein